jgi:phosphoribosylformimino-5-aminoimidazole carboxamide ribotide isomerase
MLIIPAIDLIDGRCVRLFQGDYDRKTEYSGDPVEVAKSFAEQGATWLHVVDLDGAKAGHPINLDTVRRIADAGVIQVELGGGLRDEASVKLAFEAGVSRVVVGSAAIADETFASRCFEMGDQAVLGIDTKEGYVAVHGWTATSRLTGMDLARRMITLGCRRIIYTDVATDGAFTGPNIPALQEMMSLGVPVIASGGVSGAQDIEQLAEIGPEGVIVGRALYEGRLTVAEAIAASGR